MDVRKLQGEIIEARQRMAPGVSWNKADLDRIVALEQSVEQLTHVLWEMLSELNRLSRHPQ